VIGFLKTRLGAATKPPAPPRPQPALTRMEDCRALLAACDHFQGAPEKVALASRFLALTAVRWAAVKGMRWGEVEDLDGAEPLWRIPAARMKLSRAKKGEARFEHLVPLSPQAVRVLRENGHDTRSKDALVFPGLADGTIRGLYARTEFIGRHVPHGWRASFSTILNEQLGPEWRDDIDRALAHSPKDKVEAAYNRAELLHRRRALFDRWGRAADHIN
jgi:integrase